MVPKYANIIYFITFWKAKLPFLGILTVQQTTNVQQLHKAGVCGSKKK